MDILDFQVNPVTADFRGVSITFNADAFTPEFFQETAKRLREVRKVEQETNIRFDELLNKEEDVINKSALALEKMANSMSLERDVYAAYLAGTEDVPVLMSWDFTRKVKQADGIVVEEPVPCTFEVLKKLKAPLIRALYYWCLANLGPKEQEIQTTQTSPTISEISEDGSSTQDLPTDASLVTSTTM
jgi:hypothetical protein